MKKKNFFCSSLTRRNYIEAKYVQKLFLRPFPNSNPLRSSIRSIRRWSVVRNSLSSLNLGNENDDELTQSTRNNHRRLEFLNRTSTSDHELTIGN